MNTTNLSNHFTSQHHITFIDVAANDQSGINYRRIESPRNTLLDQIKQKPVYTFADMVLTPFKPHGLPGIAILDYDNDGDNDLYVMNGPGASNSLYSNQLQETGQLTFVDVAETAGVAAVDQDSTGVSAGDIDNDGDADLLVLGAGDGNRLFENQGDGTFADISEVSGIGGGAQFPTSASMGDVNGDGLLDIVIGNSFTNWDDMHPIGDTPFERNEHNQLFINQGGNSFVDASDSSGIKNLDGLNGNATITWAIALVDYDLDGDLDIIHADDQGNVPDAAFGGVDRGGIYILQNDGTGSFTDVTAQANTNVPAGWMGLSFADFNADGYMDLFATNFGDYTAAATPVLPPLGVSTSRWFLGQADGSFADPGVGDLVATPFGWGTSATDYDNDGDTDIFYTGGMDFGLWIDASNPGVLLENDGSANFTYNAEALVPSSHIRRNGDGLAVGDLNNDGFVDVVSTSSFTFPEPTPLVPYPVTYGSPFDATAQFVPMFVPTDNFGEFQWSGIELSDGLLAVEINSADNGNNWVAVDTLGTVGLTDAGRVNRDGIGAVVLFTPDAGQTAMKPIVGGASHASQDSLTANFGLGNATSGMVEVLWSGGVRNRLYDVQAGERLVFPEIPVSFTADFASPNDYQSQVDAALTQLVDAQTLTPELADRFFSSQVQAFAETHAIAGTLIFGSHTNNRMRGTAADEHLYGQAGDDLISGGYGDDVLYGGDGKDVLRGDRNQQATGDTMSSDDVLYGGNGNDRLSGKAGNDQLWGEAGDDQLWGNQGDDLLRGGLGNDTLTGDGRAAGSNTGRDTFVLAIGEGTDTITDFTVGTDWIGLAGGLSVGQLVISQRRNHTMIGAGNETLAVLKNVDANSLITATNTTFTVV